MKDETPIPKQKCFKCGYVIDMTTDAYGDHKPRAGDISMCLSCGHASIFTPELITREPTPEEALRISLIPQVMEAQMARAHLVGDRLKNRKQ